MQISLYYDIFILFKCAQFLVSKFLVSKVVSASAPQRQGWCGVTGEHVTASVFVGVSGCYDCQHYLTGRRSHRSKPFMGGTVALFLSAAEELS